MAALAELAAIYRMRDTGRAREYAERALAETSTQTLSGELRAARAKALLALAFVDRLEGSVERALEAIQEALALLTDLPISAVGCDAWIAMTWSAVHVADYQHAFAYVTEALAVSRRLELPTETARALDAMAAVHTMAGEPEAALAQYEEAIDLCRLHDDPERLASILNNRANAYLRAGRLDEALADAEEGRRVAAAEDLGWQGENLGDTIAEILLTRGEYEAAVDHLAVEIAQLASSPTNVHLVYALINLGRAYGGLGDDERAIEALEDALTKAGVIGVREEIVTCHQLLAERFASLENWQLAYRHQRLFHEIGEEVKGDALTSRLSILRVTHEVETARRDAEIQRLHAVSLEREIDEHKRVAADLERLATRDYLTGLLNRRQLFLLARHEIARAARQQHPLAVLMIDIDHFKDVNDGHGHAGGDEVLQTIAGLIGNSLRAIDLLGRIGGEEFAAVLPETTGEMALDVAQRICSRVSSRRLQLDGTQLELSLSIGVAAWRLPSKSEVTFEGLLRAADGALYEAKQAGRGRALLAACL